jgi:hypothetical protein
MNCGIYDACIKQEKNGWPQKIQEEERALVEKEIMINDG